MAQEVPIFEVVMLLIGTDAVSQQENHYTLDIRKHYIQ